MSIPELCIKRPVFTTMIIMLPVVLGLWAVLNIGVDLFPNVDFPVITVRTTRAGASVEEMEIGVTKPVEEAVNTIAGIDELRSTTKEGVSVVTVQFLLSKNRDIAQQEVQSKVNQILNILPQGTDPPIIDKFDLDATPVLTIAMSGKRSLREVTEIADKQLSESLSGLDGVGKVILIGGQKRAVQITIDARKLEAHGLSIEDVRKAIAAQNLELPGGRVDQGNREDVLRTMGRVDKVSEFMDIIVASAPGAPGSGPGAAAQPIRIRDLGDPKTAVVDAIEEPRSLARLDGDNAVTLVVQKQSGTNTIEVINVVKRKLAAMRQVFDQTGRSDIKMQVVRDQSRFINASLHEVEKHLYIGAILVALTILLFLRDWRTMIMAGIAIPISLLGTMVVIWSLGFTLNNITMLALVLAIGIVIDDAVVVHENIFRWMEEKGYPARQAALYATKEIALAVIATTLSLVVIFLPIAFMSGRVGRFFSSFGITTAVAIMVSLFVSFTLTPMLCSRFLKLNDKLKHAGASHHSGGFYGWCIEKPYMATLRWAMRNRWVVMVLAIAVTLSSFPLPIGRWLAGGNPDREKKLAFLNSPGLLGIVGFDFLPRDDQSEYEITIETPQGYSLERTNRMFKEVEARVQAMHETAHVLSTVGDTTGQNARGEGDVTKGTIYVQLLDLEDRSFSYTTAALDMLKTVGSHPTYLARWSDWWNDAKSRQTAPPGTTGFTQFDAQARTRVIMADYPDMRTAVQDVTFISTGGRNAGIEYAIVGPDINTLIGVSERMIDKLRRNPGLVDVDTTLALRKPELRVMIDRERASDLGVDVKTISSALHTLVGGEIVSDYKDPSIGEQYDVWLRAGGLDRNDKSSVAELTVPSTKGGAVKLDNVAKLTEDRGPAQIDRYARQRKVSVVANLNNIPSDAAGRLIVDAFKESGKELSIGADYDIVPQGRARTQAESYFNFMLAFLSSLIFMYMVLAAQFESFTHPITILLALPVTIPFALLSLILLGQPLTLYSVLGLFLLIGIVKKNGILQVDYTNVLRASAASDPSVVPAEYRFGAGDPALAHSHGNGNGHDAAHTGGNGHGNGATNSARTGFLARFGFMHWVQSLPHEKRVRTWAIVEANRVRLRPILMTTLMLVASMIPIALGVGPGAANRASMAKVIVGGQALSLLLTLLVTPVAYSLFDDFSLLFRRKSTTTDSAHRAAAIAHPGPPHPAPPRVPEPVAAK